MFFCEFCQISKNTLFTEHLRTTAPTYCRSLYNFSVIWLKILPFFCLEMDRFPWFFWFSACFRFFEYLSTFKVKNRPNFSKNCSVVTKLSLAQENLIAHAYNPCTLQAFVLLVSLKCFVSAGILVLIRYKAQVRVGTYTSYHFLVQSQQQKH